MANVRLLHIKCKQEQKKKLLIGSYSCLGDKNRAYIHSLCIDTRSKVILQRQFPEENCPPYKV